MTCINREDKGERERERERDRQRERKRDGEEASVCDLPCFFVYTKAVLLLLLPHLAFESELFMQHSYRSNTTSHLFTVSRTSQIDT